MKRMELLGQPRSLPEIVEAALIYGRFPYAPALMRYWESEMIGKHLRELLNDGAVSAQGDRFMVTTRP